MKKMKFKFKNPKQKKIVITALAILFISGTAFALISIIQYISITGHTVSMQSGVTAVSFEESTADWIPQATIETQFWTTPFVIKNKGDSTENLVLQFDPSTFVSNTPDCTLDSDYDVFSYIFYEGTTDLNGGFTLSAGESKEIYCVMTLKNLHCPMQINGLISYEIV